MQEQTLCPSRMSKRWWALLSACSSPSSRATCCYCLIPKSFLTLCDPRDCSPPGSSVHRIFQARILEWVAISFSRGSSWSWDGTQVSCIGRQILYHWAIKETHELLTQTYHTVRGWMDSRSLDPPWSVLFWLCCTATSNAELCLKRHQERVLAHLDLITAWLEFTMQKMY